jgi:hypothetical protein
VFPVGQEQSVEISKEAGKLTEHHSGIQDWQGLVGNEFAFMLSEHPFNPCQS